MTSTPQAILNKYSKIIQQEVNVKEVHLLDESLTVTESFAPLGKQLSPKFGKETGQIIAAAKSGNASLQDDGTLLVTQGDKEWKLAAQDFDIRYSGLKGEHQTVEEGVIVELDLQLTDELKAEGVAREISRFLNQMRKDADYQVDDRVQAFFSTQDTQLQEIINHYTDFLKQEALLKSLEQGQQEGDITSEFEDKATFTLLKAYIHKRIKS